MKKIKSILFILIVMMSLVGCSDYKEVTFDGIENIKLLKFSPEGAEAEITAKIKNPNNIPFNIYKTEVDVFVNDVGLGKTSLSDHVKINANSERSYTFKVFSDFKNINLMEIPKLLSLINSKELKVDLKGNLKIGNFFYKRDYPFSINQNVPFSKK